MCALCGGAPTLVAAWEHWPMLVFLLAPKQMRPGFRSASGKSESANTVRPIVGMTLWGGSWRFVGGFLKVILSMRRA